VSDVDEQGSERIDKLTAVVVEIAPEVLHRYRDVAVFCLRVRGLRAAVSAIDAAERLRTVSALWHGKPVGVQEQQLVAEWRAAYAQMGLKPSRYKSSVEALLRRARNGQALGVSLDAVNLYNAFSIQCMAPIGAYDVARLSAGTLRLRHVCGATDRFDPLGAELSAFPLVDGLVVYAVNDEVLCWGFNVRDSRIACLAEGTDDAVFFSEAVAAEQRDPSMQALGGLQKILAEHGASCSVIAVADRHRTQFQLE
jgi:DNA/RNA-binding domain of Phe-tRNA-synthetase-like protein